MPRIDHSRPFGRIESGPPNFGNRIAFDEDIDRRRLVLGDIDKLAAADDSVGRKFCHVRQCRKQGAIKATENRGFYFYMVYGHALNRTGVETVPSP